MCSLFLILISCNSTSVYNDTDSQKNLLNTWHEPIYSECMYDDKVAVENIIHLIYGDFVCTIVESDFQSYLISDKYGEEGPYNWEYEETNDNYTKINVEDVSLIQYEDGNIEIIVNTIYGNISCPVIDCNNN